MHSSIAQKKARACNKTITIDNPFYDNVKSKSPDGLTDSMKIGKRVRKQPPKFAGGEVSPMDQTRIGRMKFKEDEDSKFHSKKLVRKESPLEDKENVKPDTSISNIYPKTPNGVID